jgi:hypothetical protein
MLRVLPAVSIPTVPIPERWPFPVVATLAMLVLAVLDIVGALLAKAWLAERSAPLFAAGLAVFGLLFWVYASSLRYADLATVTFGWIVLLQVGLLLIARFRDGAPIGAGRYTAVVLILALEAYLILAPVADTAPT